MGPLRVQRQRTEGDRCRLEQENRGEIKKKQKNNEAKGGTWGRESEEHEFASERERERERGRKLGRGLGVLRERKRLHVKDSGGKKSVREREIDCASAALK